MDLMGHVVLRNNVVIYNLFTGIHVQGLIEQR